MEEEAKGVLDEFRSTRVCWAGLRGVSNDEGGMEARRDMSTQ